MRRFETVEAVLGQRSVPQLVALGIGMLVLVSGCAWSGWSARRSPPGVVTAVGWTSDGRVVIGTGGVDERATLWTAKPGDRMTQLRFDYCAPIMVLSVFPLEQDQIGLHVRCSEGPAYRIVSVGIGDHHIKELAAVEMDIDHGIWTSDGRGYAQYGAEGCVGVAEVGATGLKAIDLRVPVDGTPVALNVLLPPVAGPRKCQAGGLARNPVTSDGGRFLAFFLRVCPAGCLDAAEFDNDWRVVLNDTVSGRIEMIGEFSAPTGLAVSERGGLVIAARYAGVAGLWRCPLQGGCVQPRRLVEGVFLSPVYDRDGASVVAVKDSHELVYVDID